MSAEAAPRCLLLRCWQQVEPATPTSPSRIITIYERGFPLGFKGSADIPGTQDGVNYVYNHHRLVFKSRRRPPSSHPTPPLLASAYMC